MPSGALSKWVDMLLRPYQFDLYNSVKQELRYNKRVLSVLPTGGGKTVIFCHWGRDAGIKGLNVLALSHRQELLAQCSRSFSRLQIDHNIIGPSELLKDLKYNSQSNILISTIQSITNKLDKIAKPDLIICDESHHVVSSQWQKLFDKYSDAYVIGVTATPIRLDGKGLGNVFQKMVIGPSVSSLIKDGYLVPSKAWTTKETIDLSNVSKQAGDYNLSELDSVIQLQKKKLVGNCITQYNQHTKGKKLVAFTHSVKMAHELAFDFRQSGIKVAPLDGKMSDKDRLEVIRLLTIGEIDGITSCNIVSEGFDCPSLEVAILARPTDSLSLYLQQVGRVLRPEQDKEFGYIIDPSGNFRKFGPPELERKWSLEGIENNGKPSKIDNPILVCENCLSYIKPCKTCPICGFTRKFKEREIFKEDGELVEYIHGEKTNVLLKKQEINAYKWLQNQYLSNGKKPKLLRDWKKFAAEKGKNIGWGWHLFKLIQKVEEVKNEFCE